MTRRLAHALLLAIVCGLGVIAALGLVARFRSLPGPSVGLALPLQATGHLDGASLAAIIASTLALFALAALIVRPQPRRVALDATARALLVAAWSLTLQAISLQLTSQASFGFDWRGAISSPTPWLFAACALLATAIVGNASSNRSRYTRPTTHLVAGSAAAARPTSIRV